MWVEAAAAAASGVGWMAWARPALRRLWGMRLRKQSKVVPMVQWPCWPLLAGRHAVAIGERLSRPGQFLEMAQRVVPTKGMLLMKSSRIWPEAQGIAALLLDRVKAGPEQEAHRRTAVPEHEEAQSWAMVAHQVGIKDRKDLRRAVARKEIREAARHRVAAT